MTDTNQDPKVFRVTVASEATIDELADWIAGAIRNTDERVQFVKALDFVVADLGFTIRARDVLSEAIAHEMEGAEVE